MFGASISFPLWLVDRTYKYSNVDARNLIKSLGWKSIIELEELHRMKGGECSVYQKRGVPYVIKVSHGCFDEDRFNKTNGNDFFAQAFSFKQKNFTLIFQERCDIVIESDGQLRKSDIELMETLANKLRLIDVREHNVGRKNGKLKIFDWLGMD